MNSFKAVLTVEVFGAAIEAIFVLFTLLGRRLMVTDGRRKHARSVLHEELHHRQVVTRRGAVQGCPREHIIYI